MKLNISMHQNYKNMWQLLVLRTYKTEDNKRRKKWSKSVSGYFMKKNKKLNCHLKKRSNFFRLPLRFNSAQFWGTPKFSGGGGGCSML